MTPEKRPRNFPFVWPSWLTKLLAGEAQCYFQLWFKSHYQYDKIEDATFNLAMWTEQHNELVNARARALREQGYLVTLEDTNAFKMKGRTALLSGKPDLIARRVGETVVSDGKTGKQKNSDFWQPLIYMLALKKNHGELSRGEVVYPGPRIVPIPSSALTASRENRILDLVKVAGHGISPSASPSAGECRHCDIPKVLCPHRIDTAEGMTFETSDF